MIYTGYNYDQVDCTGTITANITWQPDYSGEPRPKCVIVQEIVSASADNALPNTPTATTGIAGQVTSSLTWGGLVYRTASVVRYRVVNNPGVTITGVTCAPEGRALSPEPIGDAEYTHQANVRIAYEVAIQPVTINLSGGYQAGGGTIEPWQVYLIGQRAVGSLNVPFGLTPSTYAWSVSGGEPFGNWNAISVSSYHTASFPTNLAQVACNFKKNEPNGLVSLSATLTVPSGSVPSTLSVNPTKVYEVDRPDLVTMVVKNRPNAGADAIPNYTDGTTTYAFPTNGVGVYFNQALTYAGVYANGYDPVLGVGIRWDGKVHTYVPAGPTDHNPWGGQGSWHFVQTVVVSRTGTKGAVAKYMPQNGLLGLDTTYPYEPGPYYPSLGSPGTWPGDGAPRHAADAPSMPLWSGYSSFEADDSFKTWMMYQPPGAGSVFVPVKKIS